MDVIVNTIGSDKNLSIGQVSKTLLKKAGHEMQKEIYSAPLSGSLIITKGYGLDCKEVYHTCCPFKSTGSDQLLFRSVQDCLWFAVAAKHRSIAFPAIGTGNLGFMDREAAQIMLNAVWNFAHSTPMALEVNFVIFPSDGNRYKTFEAELNNLRPKAFHTEPPQSAEMVPLKAPTEPCIRLKSSSFEGRAEAETWLQGLLYNHFSSVCISNNFTQQLGETALEELSQTEVEGVQVEEFLEKGKSGMVVSGNREEDIAVVALKLQQMLQEVQKQYLKEEVSELKTMAQSRVKMERSPVSRSDAQIKPFVKQLQKEGLNVLRVERVDNAALETVFKLQKAQMPPRSSEDLLQLVSAQFCDMVCHIGFRPECAPPDDSCLGEGLYFTEDVHTALRLWSDRSECLLYLFVAEVLKGKSGCGKPGLVLAPGQDSGPGSDPWTRCDSVGERGVTVIFNPHQALPKFIITCSKEAPNSPV